MAFEACIDAAWIGTPHSELAAFSSSNAIDAAIVAVIRRYDAAIVGGAAKFLRRYVRPNPR